MFSTLSGNVHKGNIQTELRAVPFQSHAHIDNGELRNLFNQHTSQKRNDKNHNSAWILQEYRVMPWYDAQP